MTVDFYERLLLMGVLKSIWDIVAGRQGRGTYHCSGCGSSNHNITTCGKNKKMNSLTRLARPSSPDLCDNTVKSKRYEAKNTIAGAAHKLEEKICPVCNCRMGPGHDKYPHCPPKVKGDENVKDTLRGKSSKKVRNSLKAENIEGKENRGGQRRIWFKTSHFSR